MIILEWIFIFLKNKVQEDLSPQLYLSLISQCSNQTLPNRIDCTSKMKSYLSVYNRKTVLYFVFNKK